MIYRIKLRGVFAEFDNLFGSLYSDEMIRLGLKPPKKVNQRSRFYFTEKGWKAIGRKLYAQCRERGFDVMIERRKNPKRSDVDYKDPYQISLLPNKRR